MTTGSKKPFDWSVFPGCLTLLTLLIAIFAVAPAFFQSDERLLQRTAKISEAGSGSEARLEGVAVPGYPAPFGTDAGKSLKGMWGSDDLTLTVVEPDTGAILHTQDLSAPHEWTESIMVVGDVQEKAARAGGELLLPETFAPGTYEGRLAGTVELPRPAPGGEYAIDTVTLDLPLRLTVASPAEAAAGARASARSRVVVGGAATVVFFALTALITRKQGRA